jgi:hypothetical protein
LQLVEVVRTVEDERSKPVVSPVLAMRLLEVIPGYGIVALPNPYQQWPAIRHATSAAERRKLAVKTLRVVVGHWFSE